MVRHLEHKIANYSYRIWLRISSLQVPVLLVRVIEGAHVVVPTLYQMSVRQVFWVSRDIRRSLPLRFSH